MSVPGVRTRVLVKVVGKRTNSGLVVGGVASEGSAGSKVKLAPIVDQGTNSCFVDPGTGGRNPAPASHANK